MEDGLGVQYHWQPISRLLVLILILMEDGLGETLLCQNNLLWVSLNPYFNGRRFGSDVLINQFSVQYQS